MSEESTKVMSIEERLVEQVKEILPTVLTDKELKVVIEKAITQTFFTEKLSGDSWSRATKPPLIVEIMKKEAEPIIRETVKTYIENNSAQFKDLFEAHLNKQFSQMVLESLNHIFANSMFMLKQNMIDEISNKMKGT